MAQRVKGQDVEVLIIVGGVAQDTITDIRNFEVVVKLDKLQEGYLGETTDRYDEIFKGCDGSMEMHFENSDVFNLITSVIDRARRRVPGVKVNIKATMNMPNGERPRIVLQDAFFANVPMTFGSRSDYGNIKLDFSTSDYSVLTT